MKPVLIVGGGIAGVCVARHIERRGVAFRVVDDAGAGGASRVAGGLINPVIGVRFSRGWGVDEHLPAAVSFYRDLERDWETDLFHALPIRRLFKSREQKEFWDRKRDLAGLQPYARRVVAPEDTFPGGTAHFGGLDIEGGGWLNFPALLAAARRRWSGGGCWMEGHLDEKDVEFPGKAVNWRGEDFSALLDCRGYLPGSGWWGHLDWRPAKGEIVTVHTDEKWPQDMIWSRDVFIVPLGGGCYRVGATYSWDVSHAEVTPEGKATLLDRLGGLSKARVGVMDHRAGIRPILRDKLPVLGAHPALPGLWICNGMGSRGGTIAPHMTRLLVGSIYEDKPLPREVSVARFL